MFDDLDWFNRRRDHDARAEEANQRLAAEMVFRELPERPPEEDIDREPVPGERPHPRAQWDEARGCWIAWDEVDDEWDVVGTDTATPVDEDRS